MFQQVSFRFIGGFSDLRAGIPLAVPNGGRSDLDPFPS
jgi:hypothetical protein